MILLCILGFICLNVVGFQIFAVSSLRKYTQKNFSAGTDFPLPGISVVVPVKGPLQHLEKSAGSLLQQDYAGPLELIFAFQDATDPSLPELEALVAKNKSRASVKILRGLPFLGLNPKNSNLTHGLRQASHPWIFFCDIDTRFDHGHLRKSMAIARAEENNYVTAVTIHEGARTLGALLETISTNVSLISFFLLTYMHAKDPSPINGAANLFSKKLMEKAGGMEQTLNALTEDAVLESAFKKAGGRGHLAPDFVRVVQENQSLKGFVQRQYRWMLIAKCYFYPQMLITPILWIWQWLVLIGLFTHRQEFLLAGLFICCARVGMCFMYQWKAQVPVADRLKAPAILLCDIVLPLLWISGMFVRHVRWGGQRLQVQGDGALVKS